MARRFKWSADILGFMHSPQNPVHSAQWPHSTTGRPVRLPAPAFCLQVTSSACCHKTSGSSGSSPVFFSVAFVSSRRISFIDALPRWELECKLSSSFRSSASEAADVIAGPTVKLGLFVVSAIHDGNPPMVPPGNWQKMYSPFESFARRSTRRRSEEHTSELHSR